MANSKNASKQDESTKSAQPEHRTIVLSALARIIAKAYLSKTAADKDRSIEMTLTDSRYSVNGISNGDV